MSLKPNTKKNILRAGGGVAVMAIAAIALPNIVSGADFSASDTGRVDISTATLTVGLTDGKGSSGTFDLDYVGLAPGETQTQTIVVTNTGSIDADVSLGNPLGGFTVPTDLTPADFAELSVSVPGYQSAVPVTALPAQIDLGSLNAGETKSYQLKVSLASSAGNEWQGKTLGANATVTLNQQ